MHAKPFIMHWILCSPGLEPPSSRQAEYLQAQLLLSFQCLLCWLCEHHGRVSVCRTVHTDAGKMESSPVAVQCMLCGARQTLLLGPEVTWTARSRATAVASLMTPSPKTRLYSRGALSGRSTCSTATESVAAKITPSASESCSPKCTSSLFHTPLEPSPS